eukprot:CAMPEP_0195276282 /NCGR_PEP_ID=MMETSP0706-20130129/18437_1 /TAXON_ID=33640 /ORGANISM="Asterionellopsis glacialis, Strain CCMP134" /LENGTH=793 /DNA_ID=CAMNT_0040333883 /DNA_START=918 /DNA_END=3299 /DNA_ORIENTATION=+
MTDLLKRCRESGRCPTSIVSEDRMDLSDNFETLLGSLLESGSGLNLTEKPTTAADFMEVVKMADSRYNVPGNLTTPKKAAVLEHRRCILLLIAGSTSSNNTSLSDVLSQGFLRVVKLWLDEIIAERIGGVDLLLHMIISVSSLPVSKSNVMSSGLGKAIGAAEKHTICVGSKHESAIKNAIKKLKVNWNASVKEIRSKNASSHSSTQAQQDSSAQTKSSTSSFSSLLSKASAGKPKDSNVSNVSQHIKWSDHHGGALENSQSNTKNRKRRDQNEERDFLAKAKRSKLADFDAQDDFGVRPTIGWRSVQPLTFRASQLPRINSAEIDMQKQRCASVQRVQYYSDADVPMNPTALTPAEEAIDRTTAAQQATVGTMPFHNPQRAPSPPRVSAAHHSSPPFQSQAPAPTTRSPSPPQYLQAEPRSMSPPSHQAPDFPASQYQQQQQQKVVPGLTVGASTETVQAMGLPRFLVGSDIQALQTLAQTPGLLNTFINNNGVYDEPRILELVQNLSRSQGQSQSSQPEQQQQMEQEQRSYYQAQQPESKFHNQYGYRGDQNGNEANLHVSGYGPSTTHHDIVVLFSPYVRIDEVVMKSGFSFVNTSDPEGAKQARASLNGALLGGSSIRVIVAQRRKRGGGDWNVGSSTSNKTLNARKERPPLPTNAYGQIDYDQVRDDRGNAATKNLFVAGYGAGASEQQLREVFSQYVTVTGCVMKGSFSFVNTTDKAAAVNAREALTGAIVNGGSLRVSFAKESGRLGTSFDSTYGPNTRSPYMRNPVFNSNTMNDNMSNYSFRTNM